MEPVKAIRPDEEKNFVTPVARRTETALVDQLAAAAPGAVEMEDYCHRNRAFDRVPGGVLAATSICAGVRGSLPILCGPYAKSLMQGGWHAGG
jgi:hypothetical protein